MHIAYFITSHGYGHGVRATAIARYFNADVQITFRTLLPEQFFQEELDRPFKVVKTQYDCGCLQTDGVTVNIGATLDCYKKIADSNRENLEKEVRWCSAQKVDLIVSDITPFAFDIARFSNLPSVAVTNFTWYDIYSEYLSFFPSFKPYLEEIKKQYSYADLLIALQPPMDMGYFRKKTEVPVTGRIGKNRKDEIAGYYGIDKSKKLGLIYTGDFGMKSASWNRLSEFCDWEFLGLHPLNCNPSNFHLIDKNVIPYQDLVASSDCVISKIGYGVFSECFLNAIPLIYLPRKFFAEYPVLEMAVKKWGMGNCLSEEQYYNLQWDKALQHILQIKPNSKAECSGASVAAELIQSLI
ncbi:MAG TPA: hypothetical protein VHP36_00950 [Chitinispirillaceae bacterium]|nr:hypothetical protein [Chitinispirillaceae bacterium]